MSDIYEQILHSQKAKPCEQIFMLKILYFWGDQEFEATHKEISTKTNISEHNLCKLMPRMRRLGWLTWDRTYGGGSGNLKYVIGCKYRVVIAPTAPPASPAE